MKIVTFAAAIIAFVNAVTEPDCFRISTAFGDPVSNTEIKISDLTKI
jgi:hypothetical protein